MPRQSKPMGDYSNFDFDFDKFVYELARSLGDGIRSV